MMVAIQCAVRACDPCVLGADVQPASCKQPKSSKQCHSSATWGSTLACGNLSDIGHQDIGTFSRNRMTRFSDTNIGTSDTISNTNASTDAHIICISNTYVVERMSLENAQLKRFDMTKTIIVNDRDYR